jgi:hypothetical protein
MEWLAAFQGVMPPMEASTVRSGSYDFLTGTYEGDWKFGKPHGRGTFTSIKGVTFQGEWDRKLDVGCGEIIVDGKSKPGGWNYEGLPDGDVVEISDVVDWGRDIALSEREWHLLVSGAPQFNYNKGDVILGPQKKPTLLVLLKGDAEYDEDNTARQITVGNVIGIEALANEP